jgi:uncharacterized membrane protein YhaH (DUF805 family)
MEQVWWSRLRWRLRGAWMWPTFVALTVFDALLLAALPIAGDSGPDFVPGLLLAGFFNLVAVAVLAPVVGVAVRRRRPDMPRGVARDYAGAALVVVVTVLLLAVGLLHRPAVDEAKRDRAAQLAAAQRYVLTRAPAAYRAHVGLADSVRMDADLYRTCVPGPQADRALCLFVDTSQSPPGVTLDRSRAPNGTFGSPTPR